MKYFKLTLIAATLVSSSAFAEFSVVDSTAPLGDSQTVTLEHNLKFNLEGSKISVGQYMPSVMLTGTDLQPINTAEDIGKVKVFTIMPSIDTPVCDEQSKNLAAFVAKNAKEIKDIEFYAVTADTTFAQQRYIKENKLEGVKFLSDSLNHQFGSQTGTLISELGLLTRTIVVVDKDNKIVHAQRVPDLTSLPNLEKAVEMAKKSQ